MILARLPGRYNPSERKKSKKIRPFRHPCKYCLHREIVAPSSSKIYTFFGQSGVSKVHRYQTPFHIVERKTSREIDFPVEMDLQAIFAGVFEVAPTELCRRRSSMPSRPAGSLRALRKQPAALRT
jgi:hypothetical protein